MSAYLTVNVFLFVQGCLGNVLKISYFIWLFQRCENIFLSCLKKQEKRGGVSLVDFSLLTLTNELKRLVEPWEDLLAVVISYRYPMEVGLGKEFWDRAWPADVEDIVDPIIL